MSTEAEIDRAQAQLGKAVDRAQAGEDRQLAGHVRERGEQLARLIGGCFRMTRVHDLKNRAFEAPLRDLSNTLTKLQDLLGSVHLAVVEDQIYVNDIRIRFDINSETPKSLGQLLGRHGVGGLSFHGPLSDEQLKKLITLVTSEEPPAKGARGSLQAKLNDEGMRTIELQPPFRFRVTGEKVQAKQVDANVIYKRATKAVGEIWDNLASGHTPNPLPIRRMITEMLDMGEEDQVKELLETSRDQDSPAHSRHSLQVANLSVYIGKELGLPAGALSDLGVAACYHDAGYTMDEDGYPPPFERHGTAGARQLLRQRGFHEARIRRLMVVLQHHRRFDDPQGASLFSRIIHIADDFDILSRNRPDGALMSPPEAIARMNADRGKRYDPVLLQAFFNRVGCYPPGSLLELEDGRWVLVLSAVRKPEWFDKPLVQVMRNADGTEPEEHLTLDLAETGTVRRAIRLDGVGEVGSSPQRANGEMDAGV